MTRHPLVLYHHSPLMGSTLKGSHEYAYHTLERPEDVSVVDHSRNQLTRQLGFSQLVTLHQTHSPIIHRITPENMALFLENPLREGDGLWTTLEDLLLGVFTADCLPIFYWVRDAIGIVHAGRKGISQEIHRVMLSNLVMAGYPSSEIHVLIGPHIRACCYEVGEDVLTEAFTSYALKRNHRWYLDLEARVQKDLREDGVKMIESIPVCTYCGESMLWYSYRRGERKCRHLHFIGKKKKKKN
ncbi:MAG: polyphenol oxidase family protein [Brevinematales bacterium]|nr:polyphenol oxidase family protein [Brevinematales bacterium]